MLAQALVCKYLSTKNNPTFHKTCQGWKKVRKEIVLDHWQAHKGKPSMNAGDMKNK